MIFLSVWDFTCSQALLDILNTTETINTLDKLLMSPQYTIIQYNPTREIFCCRWIVEGIRRGFITTGKVQMKLTGTRRIVRRAELPQLITHLVFMVTPKSQYLKHQWGGCRRKIQTLDHVTFRIVLRHKSFDNDCFGCSLFTNQQHSLKETLKKKFKECNTMSMSSTVGSPQRPKSPCWGPNTQYFRI